MNIIFIVKLDFEKEDNYLAPMLPNQIRNYGIKKANSKEETCCANANRKTWNPKLY